MVKNHGVRQRAATRDALAARIRTLTGGALALAALLSGVFAGIAAATAPGRHLGSSSPGTPAPTPARERVAATAAAAPSTTIPPLPAAPGPGVENAPAPTPTASPTPSAAPAPVQAPPVVVSGGS